MRFAGFKVWVLLTGLGAAALAPVRADDKPVAPAADTLVFKDGDRVHGHVTAQDENFIVFKSDRFGELHVPTRDVVVIKGSAPEAPAAVAAPAARPGVQPVNPNERADEEQVTFWEHLSAAKLAADLREFFGSWHGRLAFSTEAVADTADRSNQSVEAHLKRKWSADEVQLNGRYDFNQTNSLTTTDLLKADGLWRHDFSKKIFTQYRPSVEWNRANFVAPSTTLPADYVLLQQEIGGGITLVSSPAHKVRVGVSENLFDVWNTSPPASHKARAVESGFVETEVKLPWSLQLTERGVYYYSIASGTDGWENRVELTKKFTETLSTAIRHETRQNSPDGRAQDYTRLKLLLGVDF
ncbi:MAG TPA: DUF481 domain-containing protein [Lacunisphaera sp.]|nr:DUF481 domain-containing protein [Lacunisphaera sp.]